jgi:glycosyltransferase involved in cell wall biosynthesis
MRVLYLSQTGMTEPLGQSQVVPYLVGLAGAGFDIDLLAFEPEDTRSEAIARVREQLGDHGIAYTWLPRRAAHDPATKAREAAAALVRLMPRALLRRPRLIHARATIAASIAHVAARLLPGARMLFDCRGLVADEYADFGHWQRGSLRYRLLKSVETGLFRRADALVVLTDRMRRWLRDEARLVVEGTPIEVIPCCVDVARFAVSDERRTRARSAIGAGDRFVLGYAGNLNAWYCDDQMAELFAAVRRRRPALFAVYTRAPSERLRRALARHGVAESDVRIAAISSSAMPEALAAADSAVSFAEPRFSKIASSPVKVAEYLAAGLPVVVNRGVGDQDALVGAAPSLLVDAGAMSSAELDGAAAALLAATDAPSARVDAQALARAHFGLHAIGVTRYRQLYERLAS